MVVVVDAWIYARASEKQTMYARFVWCILREWETERERVRENNYFFLFSPRSFAYFPAHARNLILHSRSFDDDNDALK
jgi:hypothetical protein